MEIRPRVIREELMATLNLVDACIDEVRKEAKKARIMPHEMRDIHGNWILSPLIIAKAQILQSLIQLNQERSP